MTLDCYCSFVASWSLSWNQLQLVNLWTCVLCCCYWHSNRPSRQLSAATWSLQEWITTYNDLWSVFFKSTMPRLISMWQGKLRRVGGRPKVKLGRLRCCGTGHAWSKLHVCVCLLDGRWLVFYTLYAMPLLRHSFELEDLKKKKKKKDKTLRDSRNRPCVSAYNAQLAMFFNFQV